MSVVSVSVQCILRCHVIKGNTILHYQNVAHVMSQVGFLLLLSILLVTVTF